MALGHGARSLARMRTFERNRLMDSARREYFRQSVREKCNRSDFSCLLAHLPLAPRQFVVDIARLCPFDIVGPFVEGGAYKRET